MHGGPLVTVCLVCGVELRRSWWQRGLLRPLAVCSYREGRACYDRAHRTGRV